MKKILIATASAALFFGVSAYAAPSVNVDNGANQLIQMAKEGSSCNIIENQAVTYGTQMVSSGLVLAIQPGDCNDAVETVGQDASMYEGKIASGAYGDPTSVGTKVMEGLTTAGNVMGPAYMFGHVCEKQALAGYIGAKSLDVAMHVADGIYTKA